MPNPIRNFVRELVRRRVLRTAGLYIVAAWGLSQGAAELFPIFGGGDSEVRWLIIVAIALLPVVAVLAWMYDIGGHGLERDAGPPVALRRHGDGRTDDSTMAFSVPSSQGCVQVQTPSGGAAERLVMQTHFQIGRASDCAVRIRDPGVSRHHAQIEHVGGRWRIRDLGSRNGTWVNGVRITDLDLANRCEVRVNRHGPDLIIMTVPPGPTCDQMASAAPALNGQIEIRPDLSMERTKDQPAPSGPSDSPSSRRESGGEER